MGGEDRNRAQADGRLPLILDAPEHCSQCWTCVRHCPAHAMRVIDGQVSIIRERCVRCGSCVTECGGGVAHRVRSDTAAVESLLASGRPVVAILASEYLAAMHPMTSDETELALVNLGFEGLETSVLGEELVAVEYERSHARADTLVPRLRSTCPVAVDWVRKFYPELTGALEPVVPPYIAQARLVRALYPANVAVVYVSPCWARKDEIHEPALQGLVDVTIGFDELRAMIEDSPATANPGMLAFPGPRVQAVKQLSATDGFPRRTLSARDLTDREVVTARGLADIDRLLRAIVRGEAGPSVVDMLSCEGCIDGPCVNREITVYAKRNIDASERERQPVPPVGSRQLLSVLPRVDISRRFEPTPVNGREPTAEEIDAVLAAGEFESRADVLDCGACGYARCIDHAASICAGNSTWEMCFPLQKKLLTRDREQLQIAATVDELTGLLNRRGFEARLAEEVARSKRYGHLLSMIMMDLDGFKRINDEHGHAAGDAMLRAFGVLSTTVFRSSDVTARYGGDEFAFILPDTGKTEAWAVAEKIRSSLRDLQVPVGDGITVHTTGSAGVASLTGDIEDARSLSNAADAALYRAKDAGRDRVELAAG